MPSTGSHLVVAGGVNYIEDVTFEDVMVQLLLR